MGYAANNENKYDLFNQYGIDPFADQSPFNTPFHTPGAPISGAQTAGITSNSQGPPGAPDPMSIYGLGSPANPGDPYSLNPINLPRPPQLSTDEGDFTDFMNRIAQQIQQQYQYNTPLMQAAQHNLGGIPQPNAQQFGTSPELARMLAGEGYSPENLAKMHAGATENPANAGIQEMAAAKRALSQAGMSDSPAAAGVQADVARRTGYAQNAANRDVDLNNAQTGMENFRQGVGMQTQVGLSNMEQANQMALQNANRLFAAMNTNVMNQQGANSQNASAQNNQMSNQASQVAGFLGNQAGQWQSQRNQNQNTNVQNEINWGNNQAGMDWNRQIAHWNEFNNRYHDAMGALGGQNQWGFS